VQWNARAGGEHLLEGQTVAAGFVGMQLGVEHVPALAFIGDQDRTRGGRRGVERALPGAAVGITVEAGFDHIQEGGAEAVKTGAVFQQLA
jgi:hypothetical protein